MLRAGARMFAAQTAATTVKLHVTLRKAYGFGSMVMSLLSFDSQSATFAYPGATMGAMSAAALSRASHAGEDLTAKLRDIYESRKDKTMFIAGAETLRYGDIIGVIDAAKGAGVEKVGIVTAGMRKAAGVSGN